MKSQTVATKTAAGFNVFVNRSKRRFRYLAVRGPSAPTASTDISRILHTESSMLSRVHGACRSLRLQQSFCQRGDRVSATARKKSQIAKNSLRISLHPEVNVYLRLKTGTKTEVQAER